MTGWEWGAALVGLLTCVLALVRAGRRAWRRWVAHQDVQAEKDTAEIAAVVALTGAVRDMTVSATGLAQRLQLPAPRPDVTICVLDDDPGAPGQTVEVGRLRVSARARRPAMALRTADGYQSWCTAAYQRKDGVWIYRRIAVEPERPAS